MWREEWNVTYRGWRTLLVPDSAFNIMYTYIFLGLGTCRPCASLYSFTGISLLPSLGSGCTGISNPQGMPCFSLSQGFSICRFLGLRLYLLKPLLPSWSLSLCIPGWLSLDPSYSGSDITSSGKPSGILQLKSSSLYTPPHYKDIFLNCFLNTCVFVSPMKEMFNL